MPRKARLVVPGAVYHIMGRCIDRYTLFSEDKDRERFLYLLEICLQRTNSLCYAWALMDTHYHLVLRIGDIALWEVMKPLNMRYAHYHKINTGRRGPLFMDRYKSIVTQDQKYILELIRYVHMNPARAGLCKNINQLNTYPWSGHSVVMGKRVRKFQETRAVLRRFGRERETARLEYLRFIQSGMKESDDKDGLIGLIRKSIEGCEKGRKPGCRVLGDTKYIRSVLKEAEVRRLQISRFESEGGSFEQLTQKIAAIFTIDAKKLKTRQRGGNASLARKAFAYISTREFRAPAQKVAEYLGVSSGAVSAMVNDGKKIVTERRIII